MVLLGKNVVGGLHGTWPGLAQGQLFEGVDLEVTTDFRQVLSEVLVRRLGNPKVEEVFPGFEGYSPLGVVVDSDPGPQGVLTRHPLGRRRP
jgi:hypothetical protein